MKKLIIISAFFASVVAFGQSPKQYKTNFSGANKKVQILSGANQLTVEGHNGNEVIIEAESSNKDFPEEAEGLKIVTAGTVDNTGIGASATVEDNVLKIKLPKSKYFGNFKVKVPKDLTISVKESGNAYGKWFIGGLDGELEVFTGYTTVNIKSVSGPVLAHCGYGKISVSFDKLNQNKPSSISGAGSVDVTLPSDTKANLRMSSSYSEVFTDFDLAETVIENIKGDDKNGDITTTISANRETYINRPNSNGVTVITPATPPTAKSPTKSTSSSFDNGNASAYSYSTGSPNAMYWDGKEWKDASDNSNYFKGGTKYSINGGGVILRLHSDYGNVYLRKKK
jgi:hypothetical protein